MIFYVLFLLLTITPVNAMENRKQSVADKVPHPIDDLRYDPTKVLDDIFADLDKGFDEVRSIIYQPNKGYTDEDDE